MIFTLFARIIFGPKVNTWSCVLRTVDACITKLKRQNSPVGIAAELCGSWKEIDVKRETGLPCDVFIKPLKHICTGLFPKSKNTAVQSVCHKWVYTTEVVKLNECPFNDDVIHIHASRVNSCYQQLAFVGLWNLQTFICNSVFFHIYTSRLNSS